MRLGNRLVVLCSASVLVAGCGESKKAEPDPESTPRVSIVQAGAPGQASRPLSEEEAAAAPVIEHTQADVDFMRGMMHHHQQAVVMTEWVPDRTSNRSVRLMAKRMGSSQEVEIEQMWKWLEDRGFDPADHHHAHAQMPGMLTSGQLARLKAAKGKAFDRLFLRSMTMHHEGALTMVRELQDAGGGAEAEIGNFTRHVEADQQIEIDRMRELLSEIA
ncbi:MAG TPA: DUF305 domain-containing protein [Solirubrobacter sp.]|nr:DUF305 domain-containing protein [Solirubrobacter sp.]